MTNYILVIENNRELSNFLKKGLSEEGFSVKTILNSAQTPRFLKFQRPDLIILDWDLIDIHAETLFGQIKRSHPDIPVFVISSDTNSETAVKLFNLGVIDFLSKPINLKELAVRIRTRLLNTPDTKYKVKDLELDDLQKIVYREGKDDNISLSPKEFELLKYLIINKDRVISREMILNTVWDGREYIGHRIVDVYIGYLRDKIDKGYENPIIKTVRGFGYIAASG